MLEPRSTLLELMIKKNKYTINGNLHNKVHYYLIAMMIDNNMIQILKKYYSIDLLIEFFNPSLRKDARDTSKIKREKNNVVK